MKYKIQVLILIFISIQTNFAQSGGGRDSLPTATPTISETVSENLEGVPPKIDIPREKREQALAKLLEGQRYIWNARNMRSQSATANATRLAKQALQEAIKLDPTLAEAYTALAEMTWISSPGDLDEPIRLASLAVKLNPDNFGGHHWLAWFYTIKSGIGESNALNSSAAEKAIAEWKEIARLDPRNAEAFAFLSEFYDRTGKQNERIEALKRWLASANSLNPRFYMKIMGTPDDLSPENASLKLGKALIDAGRYSEAIEYLNRAIADNPQKTEAVELLREAIQSSDSDQSANSIEALQQAVFANPQNNSLVILLAETQARSGKIDEAAKLLSESSAKREDGDKLSAASLQVALGDIYVEAGRFDEAVVAYRNALKARGIENRLVTEDERVFATVAYEKIIQAYKNANRFDEAKSAIEGSRRLFGKDDLFADKQLIEFYRETGKKQEALQTVRAARARFADDYSLLRLEASILTKNGKVDEAAALVKSLINKKNSADAPSPLYDEFSNYVFISSLYSEARRGKEAVESANQAYSASKTEEQRQIAKLSLATAQQMSGDYKSAEDTLRGLLQKSPRNPIALNNLGYFLLERNEKFIEALDLIKQAVKIDPTNPSYLDSLGWAYFKLGKLSEAERNLKAALRYETSSATIFEHLGDVYQKQNKRELAKTLWRKALNLASEAEMTERIKAKLK